jgi:argininosuccinate lyase
MKKLNENLSDLFDVEPIQIVEQKSTVPMVIDHDDPVVSDAQFARENIRELISKGNSAIDQLLLVARDTEHPRAYEVAAGLIKNLGDLNKDLLEIQKRKRDLAPKETAQSGGLSIDKAVFVGSTAELIKLVRNK